MSTGAWNQLVDTIAARLNLSAGLNVVEARFEIMRELDRLTSEAGMVNLAKTNLEGWRERALKAEDLAEFMKEHLFPGRQAGATFQSEIEDVKARVLRFRDPHDAVIVLKDENARLKADLDTERARSRTQHLLADKSSEISALVIDVLQQLSVCRKILKTLFAGSKQPFLACPVCGEVRHADKGPTGLRICAMCLAKNPDPWEGNP